MEGNPIDLKTLFKDAGRLKADVQYGVAVR